MISSTANASGQWHKHSFKVMGTLSQVEFYLDEVKNKSTDSPESFFKVVEQEMFRIDALMSPYKQNSELTTVNNLASTKPVIISKELFDLLVVSQKIAKMSEGAFDITYASVGYQYDYRLKNRPDQLAINKVSDHYRPYSIIT
jgi:thiamine biosynthesis lipoprotein